MCRRVLAGGCLGELFRKQVMPEGLAFQVHTIVAAIVEKQIGVIIVLVEHEGVSRQLEVGTERTGGKPPRYAGFQAFIGRSGGGCAVRRDKPVAGLGMGKTIGFGFLIRLSFMIFHTGLRDGTVEGFGRS